MGTKKALIFASAAAFAAVGCSSDDGANGTGGTAVTGGIMGTGATPLTGGTTTVTGGTTTVTGGTTTVTGGTTMVTGGMTPATGGEPMVEACGVDDVQPTGTCAEKAPGFYAMKTVLDVWWDPSYEANGEPAITSNPGRGKIEIYMLGELNNMCEKPDGSGAGTGVIRSCGTRLPPMTSNLTCDVYDITIPDAAWDSPNMPTFDTQGTVTDFEPGAMLKLAAQTGLVGIKMDDPNAAWPTYMNPFDFTCDGGTSGFDCFPDHDMDNKPGITAKISTSREVWDPTLPAELCGSPYDYQAAPLAVDPGQLFDGANDTRAKQVHLGLRLRIGGGGTINDTCDGGSGKAEATALETRMVACTRLDDMPCTDAQVSFLDQRIPVYNILQEGETPGWKAVGGLVWGALEGQSWANGDKSASVGPQAEVVRIGDLGTDQGCAAVRAAFGVADKN